MLFYVGFRLWWNDWYIRIYQNISKYVIINYNILEQFGINQNVCSCSFEFTWFPHSSLEFHWVPLSPLEFPWVTLSSSEFPWVPLSSSQMLYHLFVNSIWKRMKIYKRKNSNLSEYYTFSYQFFFVSGNSLPFQIVAVTNNNASPAPSLFDISYQQVPC